MTSGYDANHDRTSLADNLDERRADDVPVRRGLPADEITTSYGGTAGPQVVLGYDPGNRETSISRTIGGIGHRGEHLDRLRLRQSRRHDHRPDRRRDGTLATYVYGYDNANRVTTEVNAEGTVTFGYDSGGELLTARGSRTENYTYDSGGNRNMSGYTTGTGNELTYPVAATRSLMTTKAT